MQTPPFAESVSEGDVRWEKGELSVLKFVNRVESTITSPDSVGFCF